MITDESFEGPEYKLERTKGGLLLQLQSEDSLKREFITEGASHEDIEALDAMQQLIKEQIQKITAEDNEEAIIQKIEMYHLEIARRYKLLRRKKYPEQFDQRGEPIDPQT